MPRRLLLTLIALGLTLALTAAPTAAGGGSLAIGNGGADGEIGASFEGDPGAAWGALGFCGFVGYSSILDNHFRTALEFPLDDLPAGATIVSASLGLAAAEGVLAGFVQHAIYGYAGDGSITAADVEVTGTPVLFTPSAPAVRETHDVTSLMTPAMVSAGWAGFSLRAEPTPANNTDDFACPSEGVYPILTITYDLPNPPTPVASLADAATAAPNTGSPLAMLGFALLLMGSLAALILVNAQGVVRRRG